MLSHNRVPRFDPVLHRLDIECWILGVEMSSYRLNLIAMRVNLRTTRNILVFSESSFTSSAGYSPALRDPARRDGILDIQFGCGYAALTWIIH